MHEKDLIDPMLSTLQISWCVMLIDPKKVEAPFLEDMEKSVSPFIFLKLFISNYI